MAAHHLNQGMKDFAQLKAKDKKWVIDTLKGEWVTDTLEGDREFVRVFEGKFIEFLEGFTFKPYVFLSHNSRDKRFVRGLAHQLKSAGIRVWLDEAEIKVGESLIEKLREAIDSVDFLIIVLSQASVESPWVQKEVEIAMNQEIKNRRIKVLPILKETVPLPGFLEGKLYLDFTSKSSRAKSSKRLVEHILSYKRK
ncbi:MAG TPA: toll/interleukin-1 receptor domain-containing protein [Pyrinomonadaceae bacterium]